MLAVFSFVHHAIGTLADALQLLVFIHLLQSREPSVITARARVMWHPNKTTTRPTRALGARGPAGRSLSKSGVIGMLLTSLWK